jgi:hypothetical protein
VTRLSSFPDQYYPRERTLLVNRALNLEVETVAVSEAVTAVVSAEVIEEDSEEVTEVDSEEEEEEVEEDLIEVHLKM